MEVLGHEPAHDLRTGDTGPQWRRAVLVAWRRGLITAARTVDLLGGALAADDLPNPNRDLGGAVE
jgi:sensor domain CHASE-containing protein